MSEVFTCDECNLMHFRAEMLNDDLCCGCAGDKLQSLEAERDRLRGELEEARAGIDTVQNLAAIVSKENDDLKAQLAAARSEVTDEQARRILEELMPPPMHLYDADEMVERIKQAASGAAGGEG